MKIKLISQTVPARNLPMQFTSLKTSTLHKRSTVYTVIRSPHIDKKSREQFKFFKKKNISIKEASKKEKLILKQTIDILKQQYSLVRFTMFVTTTELFTSTF